MVNDTTATAVVPAYVSGNLSKDVVLSNGTANATLAAAFTYQTTVPTISALTPSSGSTAGGTAITISGSGFVPGTTVTIGGIVASNVTVVNATTLTAITPGYVSGSVVKDVVINNGIGSATLTGGFSYSALAPTLTSVAPATGTIAGGTTVTVTGGNFTPGTSVTIGGVAATSVVIVSTTTLTAVTPAYVSGALAKNVVVSNGISNSTLVGGFTYQASTPSVTSVTPNSGPGAGGTTITLTGSNFIPGTTVTVGGISASGVTVTTVTTLTAVTPAYTSGALAKDITINNGAGSAR